MSDQHPVNSYDERTVRYEYIHNISPSQFDALVEAVVAERPQRLLDIGCGYGAVTTEILKRHGSRPMDITLTESSEMQLARAMKELSGTEVLHKSTLHFRIDDIVRTKLEKAHYDAAVMKMVLHEVPLLDQPLALYNILEILKPGGCLVLWEMALDDVTQITVQNIVKRKDELAGFTSMVAQRYFPKDEETIANLLRAGFTQVERVAEIASPVFTERRLHQEFGGDREKLNQWENYIRSVVGLGDASVGEALNYHDVDGHISFTPPKAIYKAFKPLG